MTTVGLIFGGRSVEHKVSVASARTVAGALADAGHEARLLGVGPDGGWLSETTARRALDGEIDELPPGGRPIAGTLQPLLETGAEILFPLIHGTWGEDGTLQGLCEMLDLPYVGAGVATSALAMDKVFCKQLLDANGLAVVDYDVVTRADFQGKWPETEARLTSRFEPPVFVKPGVGGSSVGITRVTDHAALRAAVEEGLKFDDRLVVERGILGRELECSVLGLPGELEASAVGEIVPGKEFYDYSDKYIDDGAQLIAPAELSTELERRVQHLAVTAFEAIGGWGMARVDFLLGADKNDLYLNEINTLPGFTSISMYPRLWGISGLSLPDLVDRLVQIGLARHSARTRLDQGIKEWIASLSMKS